MGSEGKYVIAFLVSLLLVVFMMGAIETWKDVQETREQEKTERMRLQYKLDSLEAAQSNINE